jgi:hypothetical protein
MADTIKSVSNPDVHSQTVVNPDGSDIGSAFSGFSIPPYDYVSVSYPNATTEEYTFKTGGSSGTQVAFVEIVYTDATKTALSSATRT